MSGFSTDWLRQREAFDTAARDRALARSFAEALRQRRQGPLRIIDLAAGSGANFRVLAPLLGADQMWSLVDHDPALLKAQVTETRSWASNAGWHCAIADGRIAVNTGTATWQARPQPLDLAQALHALDLSACDAVTTTAFLDLVSAEWLDRFCDQLVRAQRPLLATLTVDGRRIWQPEQTADAGIAAAFARHQGGDKGFGRALGASAADYLAQRLAAAGYTVSSTRSDWQVGAAHCTMLHRLVEETVAVACETEPSDAAHHAEWLSQRTAQIEAGTLSLTVGHLDVLALPQVR